MDSCQHLESFTERSRMFMVVVSSPSLQDPCGVMFMRLPTHFYTLLFLHCSATPHNIQIYYIWCIYVCWKYLFFVLFITTTASFIQLQLVQLIQLVQIEESSDGTSVTSLLVRP